MDKEEYDGFEETKSAKFNAGVLSTKRIDKLLDTMNSCKHSLSAWNLVFQDWNYNIWFNNIDSLFDEIEGFLNEEESKKCIKFSFLIDKMMSEFPIHSQESKHPEQQQVKYRLNKENLTILKRALQKYERIVRRYGIKYQIITAVAEEDYDL